MRQRHLYTMLALALTASLGLVACGDDDPSDGDDGGNNNPNNAANNTNPNNGSNNGSNNGTTGNNAENNANNSSGGGPASFVTYNVGLPRGFVDYASDRVGPVAEALAGSTADVVCLQEVWLVLDGETWTTTDVDDITAATSTNLPHSYHVVTEPESAGAGCTEEEVAPVEMCAQENCADVSDDNLSTCIINNCGDEFFAASAECQGCAAAQLGNPLDVIISTCTDGGANSFAYNGHNGLLLLSKHELKNTEILELPSTLTYRSALRATVDIPGFGETDVYCTHIASDLSNIIDYPGTEFDSFQAENEAQVNALTSWIDTTSTAANVVFMGDFNTGPAVGDFAAELPDSYQLILDAGFTNSNTTPTSPCTYCRDENTLNDGTGGLIIDHIFHKLAPENQSIKVERVYDMTQPIETPDGTLDLHLSDHFGLELTTGN